MTAGNRHLVGAARPCREHDRGASSIPKGRSRGQLRSFLPSVPGGALEGSPQCMPTANGPSHVESMLARVSAGGRVSAEGHGHPSLRLGEAGLGDGAGTEPLCGCHSFTKGPLVRGSLSTDGVTVQRVRSQRAPRPAGTCLLFPGGDGGGM